MNTNYFKIALRNIKRQKLYTFINIMGLMVGLASFVFIALWVMDEMSYEKMHENADEVYLVHKRVNVGSSESINFSTPFQLASRLYEDVPEVINAFHLVRNYALVNYGEQFYTEDRLACVDSNIFKSLSFDFIEYTAKNVFEDKFSVAINESTAKKYFGEESAIGKVLTFDRSDEYVVTGVFRDIEGNTQFNFDMYIPTRSIPQFIVDKDDWYSHFMETYIQTLPGTDRVHIDTIMTNYIRSKMTEDQTIELLCQPISERHLYSLDGKNERIQYVYIFSLIGILTLIIACINYMNIATSLSVRRSREIGLKKVVGAQRPQLIWQFLGESFIQVLIAMLLAMVLVELLRPWFNELTNKDIVIPYLSYGFLPGLLLIVMLTTFIAGFYPSFLLSSFKPVDAFRGRLAGGKGQANFRKGLVVFQFAVSTALIISSLMIYIQLRYVNNKNLGFDKENLIYIYHRTGLGDKYESFKNELLRNPGIVSMCEGSSNPGSVWSIMRGLVWEGKEEDDRIAFAFIASDYDYIKTTGLEIVEGRDFSEEYGTDTANVIVNQTAAKLMGFEGTAIGKTFGIDSDYESRIVGVVKDFNSLPLTNEIEPLIMVIIPQYYRMTMIRLAPGNIGETLDYIEEIWNDFAPGFPFEYRFLDESLGRYYRNETRVGNLALVFTIIALLITCIGLFGLASHTAQRKTKEIGIRKVFGSSVGNVIALFVREFIKWVIISNIIAWPVAWLFVNDWLNNFAYHIDIQWWVFILAGVVSVLIAALTVIYQSYVAAIKNPVETLKYE